MHGTGIFHPQFKYHPRRSIDQAMPDRIEIYAPTGVQPEWTPDGGMSADTYELVYRGNARIQPDQDWKARDRNFANELTSVLGLRIGIPVRGNELTPDKAAPFLSKNWKVVVIEPSEETQQFIPLEADIIVRTAIQASEKWLRTFVADVGTRSTDGD